MKAILLLILSAVLSTAALADSGPANRIFKFGYKNPKSEVDILQFTDEKGVPYDAEKYSPAWIASAETLCDQNIYAKSTIGKTVVCLSVTDEGVIRFLRGRIVRKTSVDIQMYVSDELPQVENLQIAADQQRFYHGLFLGVSIERPIYFVYDMEAGVWSYGFNMSRLRLFN